MSKDFRFSFLRMRGPAVSDWTFYRTVLSGLITLLWLLNPSISNAHSGGLDKMGCHHDRKKGGYHCHRGPLAGQFFATKEEAVKALEQKKQDETDANKDQAESKKDDSKQNQAASKP